MYLKRIELQGFKSFADKTKIDFEKGITGIVGPNGSGKSNISDAIRWVLGEQSAKTLRGSKMEDVIFTGTAKRKPLGFCEVTLVLDNKDEKMPIDYSEVSVTRRVFRSGESEYYINKTSCRLKDIKELFMDTGIGIDGYSIIGQGKIDNILSSKSEDRRLLFEEAAGIVKYKTRKQEAEKKLEKTEDNLIRINDIKLELEKQLDPLEKQSKDAKEYIALSEKLKNNEVNLFVREIERLRDQLLHIENQQQLINDQISYNNNEKSKLENVLQDIQTETDKLNDTIDQINNDKYRAQNLLEKNNSQCKLNDEKISFSLKEINRIEEEIVSLHKKVSGLEQEKVMLNTKKEEFRKEVQEIESEIEIKLSYINEIDTEINFKEKDIEDKKGDMIQFLNLIADKKGEINTINSFNRNIVKRLKQIDIEANDQTENLKSIYENLEYKKKELSDITKTIEKIKEDKSRKIENKTNINNSFKTVLNELDTLKTSINTKESKYKVLNDMKGDYEGYYRSVRTVLKYCKGRSILGKAVRGVVAELINVDKQYEKAIEVALGSTLQNIVTETADDAKKIINYLKKIKGGRVTLLPMESIKPRGLNNRERKLLSTKGIIGVASELIRYDKDYTNILGYLLGRVLVVQNIDYGIKIARAYNHSLKIVTLDGDVLNPGGSMTGGSINNSNTNLLARDRQIGELKKELTKLKEEFISVNKKRHEMENKLASLQNNIDDLEEQLGNYNINHIKLENDINNIISEINRMEKNRDLLQEEKNQLDEELKESNEQIKSIEDELLKLKEKNNITQEDVNNMVMKSDSEKKQRKEAYALLNELKIKKASLNQEFKGILQNIDRVTEDITLLEGNICERKEELNKNKDTVKVLKVYTEDLKSKEEELQLNIDDYANTIIELKNKRVVKNQFLEKKQLEFDKLEEKIKDLEKSKNTIEVKKAKYDMQLENYNNKLWEEYELSYQMALKYKENIENVTKVQNDIKKIKAKIKDLGTVNMNSIEEYETIKERFEFITSQQSDLVDAKKRLKKVIKDMEKKMKEQFLYNFKIIRENFKEIFSKLFGGGKADIYLVDKEDILTTGIDIIAQPPGKKLQNISLLSGGEKALTAISLLFAILKLKPSPFCILDEIEAALDDANVYRFADYLKEFIENTQFIVITHRKGTMESVDSLYGVTMEEEGISRLVSVKLSEKQSEKAS
ncbi:chromosome segregation protein SMC [Clostridiisalibacter paucivorans]|uniref:chromosome segregation protein SMC n=1 Tax=Clostridiisalibacter paucivorans TaxID=408753 RepID=UPI00047DD63F|nr:chromosome segregation protein SMC [Clostridiisalibacter paucivorans]